MKHRKLWMLGLFVFVMAIMAFPTQAKAAKVKVTSVKVQAPYAKKIEVAKGKSVKVVPVVTVTPNNSKNKKVTFKSNNKKIATVNSKGIVKGKKAGKTKIVITSKKNKKKKATIQVVVKKKPIKKVALSKTNVTLTVGTPMKLAATVTAQKGSSKNVYWTSDQPGIATVSQDGMITPLKPGKATVTVAATDGSKKKATCVVNVVAKKPVVDNTVSLLAMKIEDSGVVTFSLNRPFKLSLEDVKVMVKTTAASKYVYELKADTLTTTDHQNYIMILPYGYYEGTLEYGNYVKLEIGKLNGAKKSIEAQFLPKADTYTDYSIITGTAGKYMSTSVYTSHLSGYCNIKITNLPEGLKATPYSQYANIEGTLQKTGVYKALMTAEDEYGNTLKKDIFILIGDANNIVAHYKDVEVWTGVSYTSVQQSIKVAGGSGSYRYSIASSNGNFSVTDTGTVKGKIYAAGKYQVVVNVVDAKNPAIATKVTLNITANRSAIVTGTIKSLGGGICDDNLYVYFYQGDKYSHSGFYTYSDVINGLFRVALQPGKWNVVVYSADTHNELYNATNLNVTQQTEQLNFQIPYVKVNVITSVVDAEIAWKDADGEIVGCDDLFYVKPGTYHLVAYANDVLTTQIYDVCLDFTADKKDLTVKATRKPKKNAIPQITLGTHAVTLERGDTRWLKFVPTETAQYAFYSTAKQDTYGYLCNAEGVVLFMTDSGGSNGNFKIQYMLEAGKTYYFGAEYWYSSDAGTFNVVLEKVE